MTSENDKCTYKYITLANQMRCLLIEDPDVQKSAASLTVGVGSCLDTRPMYGTALFLMHMLGEGTKKYPNPNAYKAYF